MNSSLVIGIDLDNTIINYNSAFVRSALQLDFISEDCLSKKLSASNEISPKSFVKKHLLTLDNGQYKWESLQGLVYGKFIYYAEIFPGVVNFLAHCQRRGHTVVFVSHKTEFGHYDKSKTSLRKAALNFLEENNCFSGSYGIKKKDVYFTSTRQCKVNKISELNCDYFIDDLLEVFEEPHFPKNTKRILFNNKAQSVDWSFNSWYKINEFFFKTIESEDVLFYTENAIQQSVKKIKKINDVGNSNIFRIEMKTGETYAGKLYPDPTFDNRGRLEKEKKACEFFNLNKFQNVSKIIWSDKNLNFGLFKWIDGPKVKELCNRDIRDSLTFVKALVSVSKTTNYQAFDLASAACISGKMIEEQILNRFQKISNVASSYPNLKIFLEKKLAISIEEMLNFAKKNWPGEFSSILPREDQLLSPSDFGFHNVIKSKQGLRFIDFEYFGWDDPAKLTSDFLLHPGMSLTKKQKKLWVENMISIFSNDKFFNQRLKQSYSLYGLCWCLIQLNVFITDEDVKDQTTVESSEIKKKQMEQLEKSEKLLKSLNQSYSLELPYE